MLGVFLMIILAIPPINALLEKHLIGQMLIEIPVLIIAGIFFAKFLPFKLKIYSQHKYGLSSLLLAIFPLIFWLLPRNVDAVLSNNLLDIFRFLTLPFITGLFLAISWHILTGSAKAFVLVNGTAMLFVMGWLYLASPVRLCNNYLLNQQEQLGKAILTIGSIIALLGIYKLFFGPIVPKNKH